MKRYFSFISLMLVIMIAITGCTRTVKSNSKNADILRNDIKNIYKDLKSIYFAYSRPRLILSISFSKEPDKDTYEKIFEEIDTFAHSDKMDDIETSVGRAGMKDCLIISIDINGDGDYEYQYRETTPQYVVPGTVLGRWSIENIPIGNNPVNLINGGGIFASDKSNIYYSNAEDENKLYKIRKTGNGMKKILDESVGYLNVVGDWIYFKDSSEQISKCKIDGSEKEVIVKDKCSEFGISGYWIYYTLKDTDGMFKITTYGKEKTLLSSDKATNLNVDNMSICYITKHPQDKSKNIVKYMNQYTEEKMDVDIQAERVVLQSGTFYYINKSDGGKLYMTYITADKNNEIKKVTDCRTGNFNFVGGNLYYRNLDDNGNIYSCKPHIESSSKSIGINYKTFAVVDTTPYLTSIVCAVNEENKLELYRTVGQDGQFMKLK